MTNIDREKLIQLCKEHNVVALFSIDKYEKGAQFHYKDPVINKYGWKQIGFICANHYWVPSADCPTLTNQPFWCTKQPAYRDLIGVVDLTDIKGSYRSLFYQRTYEGNKFQAVQNLGGDGVYQHIKELKQCDKKHRMKLLSVVALILVACIFLILGIRR